MTTSDIALLTAQEAADLLQVTIRTLQRLESDGVLKPIRIGRAVRYSRDDLAAFIDARKASA